MKRRIPVCMLSLFLAASVLTGCGNAIPEMTEEETKMVEEYAAQLILKYDKNYQSSILTEEEKAVQIAKLQKQAELKLKVEEAKNAAQEAAETEDDSSAGSSSSSEGSSEAAANTDIDAFLGLNQIEIEYQTYEVAAEYPLQLEENDWQGVARATGDNQLLVFEYSMTNTSDADQLVDLASLDAKFAFKLNGSISKTPITTLLLNDISTFRDTLSPGETRTLVLIVEVSSDVANGLSSAQMIMKYNGERGSLTLL